MIHTTELTLPAQIDVPNWNTAKDFLLPYLAPIEENQETTPALRSNDLLCSLLTSRIKMYLACFYQGSVIPLTENLISEWSVSTAIVQMAIEENMAKYVPYTKIEKHENREFEYYSIHNELPFFNSLLLFYAPFQSALQEKLGETFYAAAPEIRTGIVFHRKFISKYTELLRDDVLLTHDCSLHPLSRELIEISSEGTLAVLDTDAS